MAKEVVWRNITHEFSMKIPAQFRGMTKNANKNNPYIMLESIIRKTNPSLIQEAGLHMRAHLKAIANGSLWTLAQYARDMITIESPT